LVPNPEKNYWILSNFDILHKLGRLNKITKIKYLSFLHTFMEWYWNNYIRYVISSGLEQFIIIYLVWKANQSMMVNFQLLPPFFPKGYMSLGLVTHLFLSTSDRRGLLVTTCNPSEKNLRKHHFSYDHYVMKYANQRKNFTKFKKILFCKVLQRLFKTCNRFFLHSLTFSIFNFLFHTGQDIYCERT